MPADPEMGDVGQFERVQRANQNGARDPCVTCKRKVCAECGGEWRRRSLVTAEMGSRRRSAQGREDATPQISKSNRRHAVREMRCRPAATHCVGGPLGECACQNGASRSANVGSEMSEGAETGACAHRAGDVGSATGPQRTQQQIWRARVADETIAVRSPRRGPAVAQDASGDAAAPAKPPTMRIR